MATRNQNFASLYRKVITMKQRMEAGEKRRLAKERSSVGTVEAIDASEEELNAEEELDARAS
ncbi:MAG: hypothetical protein OEY14_00965 [Myxococcales bacterium]|nr:hypothetical protein [Myxococcales bacterium]